MLVKDGMSLWDHLAIIQTTDAERQQLLNYFAHKAITVIHGIPLNERIVTNSADAKKTVRKVWELAEARQEARQEGVAA